MTGPSSRTAPPASLALAAALVLPGCAFFQKIGFAPDEPDPEAIVTVAAPEEPSHVVVQHVLISCEGTEVPGATRTRDEAQKLAHRVLDDARRGRDFAELVRLYSDDRPSSGPHKEGIYALANWGIPAGTDESERRALVRGFTAMAFSLPVGGVGLVDYDPNASPFGWHVVKRLR